MSKSLKILGNGQIWDVQGISPFAPGNTFEDLFSGRALARMAREFEQRYPKGKRIFSRFKERGVITGLSVTRALLSNDSQAKKTARIIFEDLAKNGALGIEVLTKGKGCKKNWTGQKKDYWRNLDWVIIGGGVSKGISGKLLVNFIKKHLSKNVSSQTKVYQAKFPGKEAGALGAVINIIKVISEEAMINGQKVMGGIGLDLGREELGMTLLAINAKSERLLKQKKHYWFFKHSVKTPYRRYLKNFLDSRQDYTKDERIMGEHIRSSILKSIVDLIIQAQTQAKKLRLVCSRNIGVAVPGSTSSDGYIINSTDYLPFFKKQDGFNFAKSSENFLAEKNSHDFKVHIINDGIAAGIANVYFSKAKDGKFAFLGVGSGLGGCVGVVR